jgi:hypothetical protein
MDQLLEPDQRFSLLLSQMDTELRRQGGSVTETTPASYTRSNNGSSIMEQNIDTILSARETTHGCYVEQSTASQTLKRLCEQARNWDQMPCYMRESVHLIQQKVARIICGNPFERDHWVDIMGYAALVLRELDRLQEEGRNDGTSQQSTD